MGRSLDAWINQVRIGTLRENKGLWAFVYSAQWLADPAAYPLCPMLPLQAEEHHDGASHRPVHLLFGPPFAFFCAQVGYFVPRFTHFSDQLTSFALVLGRGCGVSSR